MAGIYLDYINDVLTRLMKGETDYKSLIPCRSSYARLLPTGRKNYKPLPKDNGEGQKRWPDPVNRAILKLKCFFLKLFCTSLGFAASLVEELAENLVLRQSDGLRLTENYVVSNAKIKAALGMKEMPVRAKDGQKETIKSFAGK